MLILNARYLEARELPARDPYPPTVLVSLLDGTETLNLIASPEVGSALESVEPFAEVALELRWRRVDLASVGGGGGKAYRLKAVGVIEQ